MKDVKYVIFDLDGTLIDSFDTIVYNCRATLKRVFNVTTSFDFTLYREKGLEILFDDLVQFENLEYNIFKQAFDSIYAKNFLDGTSVIASTLELLEAYREKGLSIIVLTNKRQNLAEDICKSLLNGKIDYIIGRNDEFPIKCKEKVMMRLSTYDITPAQCLLYVGDSEEDVKCAEYLCIPFKKVTL